MNDDCRWFAETLPAYLDRETLPEESARLEAHAAACAACAAERRVAEDSWRLFKAAHPPEALPARLRRNPYARRRFLPAMALGAAAALLLLIIRQPPPASSPPPAMPASQAPLLARKASGLRVPPVPGLAPPPRPAPRPPLGGSGLTAAPFTGPGPSGLDAAPYLPEKRSGLPDRWLRFAVVDARSWRMS